MTDGTAEVAKAAGADRVIHEPVNQIARARNAGAAATGAEFLVFVDADTKISATLLTRALQCLRSGHCAGGAAPWSVLRAKPARSAASPSPSGSGFPDLPAPRREFFLLSARSLRVRRRFRPQTLHHGRSMAFAPAQEMGPCPGPNF